MENKLIDTMGMYNLVVGASEIDGKSCYQIINKKYGVVEIETKLFPQAIKFMGEISAGLQAVLDMAKEDKEPSMNAVVPIKG